ncbi:MAG: class I SAM-dependent methyltransferase [Holosporaceae bacterium]|jgi:SAM-dependent methyltransferase|nr:class I SAM-dependent methyltransferase [Holosporaceae bacterium]
MEHTKIFFPDDFCERYSADTFPCELQEIRDAVGDKITLFAGFKGDLPDLLDNGKLYCAVPEGRRVIHWPKIRPFKTVVVDPEALPFAAKTFETAVINHCLEFSAENVGFLREIFRVLKRDGTLTAAIFNGTAVDRDKVFGGKIRSPDEIVADISEASFRISKVCGIKKNSKFPMRKFDYEDGKYGEMLIGLLRLLSDIIIVTADKSTPVSERVCVFEERYEMI